MTLKKLFLFQVALYFMLSPAFAQTKDTVVLKSKNKFYLQMGIGYGFRSGGGTFDPIRQYSNKSVETTYQPGSLGKGIDLSLGFGKKVSKNLGLELELGYLFGGSNTENNQFYDTAYTIHYTDTQQITFKTNTFRINPKLLLELPVYKENIFFYGKIGYMFGFGNQNIAADESVVYANGQTGQGHYEWTKTGGMVYGSTTALGFRFVYDEHLSLFAEFTAANLNRKFTKENMTKSVENGQNDLDKRTVRSKEIVYVDDVTTTASPDQTKPHQELIYKSNYSSVGFRVGLVVHF